MKTKKRSSVISTTSCADDAHDHDFISTMSSAETDKTDKDTDNDDEDEDEDGTTTTALDDSDDNWIARKKNARHGIPFNF